MLKRAKISCYCNVKGAEITGMKLTEVLTEPIRSPFGEIVK